MVEDIRYCATSLRPNDKIYFKLDKSQTGYTRIVLTKLILTISRSEDDIPGMSIFPIPMIYNTKEVYCAFEDTLKEYKVLNEFIYELGTLVETRKLLEC